MTSVPFRDVLTRALRWGGFVGVGIYLVGVMTENPSIYTSEPKERDPLDSSINLDKLDYNELRYLYESAIRRKVKEQSQQ